MSEYQFSVVIATYNRPQLCVSAIDSILNAARERYRVEIVVVDDASETPFPRLDNHHIKVLRQDKNAGPGPARMRGIREAEGVFVLILDDDDQLRANAFETVSTRLAELSDCDWLVAQFATSNACSKFEFQWLKFDDYMSDRVSGDYTPVFHRERFLASDLSYPQTRLGGEHLLWWALSQQVAIPTWNNVIVNVGDDASVRLTDVGSQVVRANEHLALAESTWRQFGTLLKRAYPHQATRVSMGGVTYAVLAGHRFRAFPFLINLRSPSRIIMATAILVLPRKVVIKLFQRFRSGQLNSVD
ncbi:glycosyltransferase family 2 protein [Marinobacter sp.]|uniref:glycosyltransferase family 2 protein n=1 Tax=Marinobacter sp. TaxID=50741 RepID=UPI003A9227AA